MTEFTRLARSLVDAVSLLVGGRPVYITDNGGMVVASTEKAMIGSFPQEAAKAITSGRTVRVSGRNLKNSSELVEGCNVPVLINGSPIGTIGLGGNLKKILVLADLLQAYAQQYFRQQELMDHLRGENETRQRLLNLLLYGTEKQESDILLLCRILSVQIRFPVRVLLFSGSADGLQETADLSQALEQGGLLKSKGDFSGPNKHGFVLLRSGNLAEPIPDAVRLEELLESRNARLSIGSECRNFSEIPFSFAEACALGKIQTERICDISKLTHRLDCLIENIVNTAGSHYIRQVYRQLCGRVESKDLTLLLHTAEIYYQEERSVKRASAHLHLHKNTLLYRMNHLFSLLELKEESCFTKEFLIRLILTYDRSVHHSV